MAESFSVGEIAIYARAVSKFYGAECMVVRGLAVQPWLDQLTGETGTGPVYEIWCAGDNKRRVAEPHELRKRRPPQDWTNLCNLTELPREVTHV